MGKPEYKCVMIPPKLERLQSKRWRFVFEQLNVEGFTRDGHGKDIPNGISFVYIRSKVEELP